MKTKRCNYCGEEIEESARRCQNCGSVVDVEVEDFAEDNDKVDNKKSEETVEESSNTSDNLKDETTEDRVESSQITSSRSNFKHSGSSGSYGSPPEQDKFNYNIYPNNYNAPCIQKSNPLSNGLKVFITVICSVIPGLGQLAGIIISIIFMNTQDDVQDYADRRSFGLALLIACIVMFLLSCIGCFALALMASFQGAVSY